VVQVWEAKTSLKGEVYKIRRLQERRGENETKYGDGNTRLNYPKSRRSKKKKGSPFIETMKKKAARRKAIAPKTVGRWPRKQEQNKAKKNILGNVSTAVKKGGRRLGGGQARAYWGHSPALKGPNQSTCGRAKKIMPANLRTGNF